MGRFIDLSSGNGEATISNPLQIGFIVPFKDKENRWFCSEWCSNALKIAGCKKLWTKEPSKISPNRLYRILKNF